MKELSLRQKSVRDLIRRVIPLKKTIKQWFYHAGVKFLQSHQLTDDQERFLEEVTDFFVENLEELENNAKFFKKVEMGPVELPKEKKVKV
jgi:rhamnogalacturonyl hydrolase YesR